MITPKTILRTAWAAVAFTLATAGTRAVAIDNAYNNEVTEWRRAREARLRSDGGWLTVAGLFWLKEGANSFGRDDNATVRLPGAAAPARAGVFRLSHNQVTVEIDPAITATINDKKVISAVLKSDTLGEPDVLRIGRLMLNVVQRDGRTGIRLKDLDSPTRAAFKGLSWFPVAPEFRVVARFVTRTPPVPLSVPNILGYTESMPSPGDVTFELGGRSYTLAPVYNLPDTTKLFFIFRDGTSGKGTYPSGRFLDAALPKDGTVVLDFNKAYTPPCGFTAYATCPMPPKQNHLAIPIPAGERFAGHP